MREGLPRDAGKLAGRAFLLAGAALIALALFAGGGSTYGPLVGVGGATVVVAAAALALALFGVIPWPALERTELVCLALLAGLVVWIGFSVLWSVTPDRSWEYFNRGVVYLAFALLGLFIAATVPDALRLVSAGLTVLFSAVIVWALAGKVVPALFPDGERIARLRDPIDYWNGLALVAAMALPLGLSFAVRREYPQPVRIAAVVLLFATAVALLLTYSRGGVVVALLVIAAYLGVSRQRVEAVAALLIALPPAIAVSAWAFTQPGIASDLQPASVRETDGLQLGLALLVAGSAVAAAAYYVLGREERWRPRFRWKLSGARLAGGALVALVIAVLAVSRGDPIDWARDGFDEFTNPVSQAGTNPERLGEFNLNSRWTWWEEAWTLFTDDPVGGTGAGAFAVARRPIRTNTTFATEPHNLALQFLAETGLVGFLLFAGLVATAVVAVVRAVRRARGGGRGRRRCSGSRPTGVSPPCPDRLRLGLPRADGACDGHTRRPPRGRPAGPPAGTRSALGGRCDPRRRRLSLLPRGSVAGYAQRGRHVRRHRSRRSRCGARRGPPCAHAEPTRDRAAACDRGR